MYTQGETRNELQTMNAIVTALPEIAENLQRIADALNSVQNTREEVTEYVLEELAKRNCVPGRVATKTPDLPEVLDLVDPTYWIVKETRRTYDIMYGRHDGWELWDEHGFITDGHSTFEVDDVLVALEEDYSITAKDLCAEDWGIRDGIVTDEMLEKYLAKNPFEVDTIVELVQMIDRDIELYIKWFKEDPEYVHPSMFLTLEECEEYIREQQTDTFSRKLRPCRMSADPNSTTGRIRSKCAKEVR